MRRVGVEEGSEGEGCEEGEEESCDEGANSEEGARGSAACAGDGSHIEIGDRVVMC